MQYGNIRNMDGYINGLIDFSVFAGCFPGKRSFTDLDAITERKGNFLVLEKKGYKKLTVGQHRMINQMVKTGLFTVIFFGPTEYAPEWIVIFYPGGRAEEISNPSLKTLRALISEWYEYANTHPSESYLKDENI